MTLNDLIEDFWSCSGHSWRWPWFGLAMFEKLRSFFLGRELASRHFEARQKLDIAPLSSSAALADAESLLGCAKLR